MKQVRKLLGLLLALVMVFSLAVTAFAVNETGTITVDNPKEGETYTAYKIFDVTYNEDKTAYSYTIDSVIDEVANPWFATVREFANETANGLTLTQVQGTTKYNVALADTFRAAKFAVALQDVLNVDPENPDKQMPAGTTLQDAKENEKPVKQATGLDLGYYFVTTTSGALCNLTTTNPTATIHDKNDMPFDKVDDQESVDVGQTVNYVLTGKVPDTTGFTTYTYQITDVMSEGLTFKKDVKVYINGTELAELDGDGNRNYTLKYESDGTSTFVERQAFELSIDVMKLTFGQKIEVKYSATVNDHAVTVIEKNHATLRYSNNPNDASSYEEITKEETVYSGKIVVDKYAIDPANPDNHNTKLAGAKFVLYKEVKDEGAETTHREYYKSTLVGTNNTNDTVSWMTSRDDATVLTTDDQGAATFNGLQNGVYYLEEIEAPDGYNLLTAPVKVLINPNNNPENAISISQKIDPKTTGATEALTTAALTATTVVGNNTGSEMPETGGIGTTIFYVAGAILLVSAAVLLITKKRMSNVQ